jgi:hypothetical protein
MVTDLKSAILKRFNDEIKEGSTDDLGSKFYDHKQ